MRFLTCLLLGVLLPAGEADAQIRVQGSVGINVRLPRVRIHAQVPVSHSPRTHRRSHRRIARSTRVVVAPPAHRRGCTPRRHVRGRWKTVRQRVWVPAVYEWRRDACGRYFRVIVRHGYWHWSRHRIWVTF